MVRYGCLFVFSAALLLSGCVFAEDEGSPELRVAAEEVRNHSKLKLILSLTIQTFDGENALKRVRLYFL